MAAARSRRVGVMDTGVDDGWAEAELGAARLGVARRTARLLRRAGAVGAQPSASLPQACGDAARAKAP